jgi:hypothetical protein
LCLDAGHTCGIADLTLTKKVELERKELLVKVKRDAEWGLDAFLSNTNITEGMSTCNSVFEIVCKVFFSGDKNTH